VLVRPVLVVSEIHVSYSCIDGIGDHRHLAEHDEPLAGNSP
jgi:hypothetical protein